MHTRVRRNTPRRLLWAAALLVTAGWSEAGFAADQCLDDGDCRGLLLCREGRCVPVHCREDAQCPAGRMCREELCRIRQCYAQRDCPVQTRCEDGLCAIPQPSDVRRNLDSKSRHGQLSGFRMVLGPAFPTGLLAQCDVPLGAARWLSLGLGSTIDSGGLTWKLGIRSAPVETPALSLEIWGGLSGLSSGTVGTSAELAPGAPGDASAVGLATGSGRFLFAADRAVNALWWGAGGGLGWRHGAERDFLLRLDAGALLLYNGRYPAGRDFAFLPAVSLQWGLVY